MEKYVVFPNAPITEALLDIRAELPKEIDLSTLESFHDLVRDRFPEKEQRFVFSSGFQLSPGSVSQPPGKQTADGYLFRSPAEGKVVQARLNGFTFNKLRPYKDWETFCGEARTLWDHYTKVAKPVRVTRIALRYINKIDIPLPMKDFKEYILTAPEIAPRLPQSLAHFFFRLVIPRHDIGTVAVITETIEAASGKSLPLIFDIDVFAETVFVDDAGMWKHFDVLREFKNEVFFESLTDKAKELFK